MQNRRFLLLAAGLIASQLLSGQSLFQMAYQMNFFDQALAVEALPGANMMLAGSTKVLNQVNNTPWLVRLNAAGAVLWSKTISTGANTIPADMVKMPDGNLLVLMNNLPTVPNGSSTSSWMKITPDGVVLWAKKAINNSFLIKIRPLANGDFALCGESITFGNTFTGMLVRINGNGDIIWSTVFGEPGNSFVYDCSEDALGFIFCCGQTSATGGDRNGFWAKLGASGNLVAPVKRYGVDMADEFIRILPAGNDRYWLCGYSAGANASGYSAVWLLQVDSDGNQKASYAYSLDETNLTVQDACVLPGDQYVFALGTRTGTISPAILMKINGAGDQLFASRYKGGGESDVFLQVKAPGAGLLSCGATVLNGDADLLLVSTDLNGKFDNEDCCPIPLNITRSELTPQTSSFVPTQTAFFAIQPATFTVQDKTADSRSLCRQFDLDFSLSKDTICRGECVEITNETNTPGVAYSWEIAGGEVNPDKPNEVCHSSGPALVITRKAALGGCEKTLTKTVYLGAKSDDFPNAFTPNGDGSNDVFRPLFGCPAYSMNLQIYNRWGQRVFQTTDPSGSWDGRVDGQNAPSDVYVWKLEYEVDRDGQRKMLMARGQVTLLR